MIYDNSHIKFVEETHTYTVDGVNPISVSGLIGALKPKFDTEYWIAYKARQYSRDPEDVRQEWDELNRIGIDRGNKYHPYLERRLSGWDVKEYIPEVEDYLSKNTDQTVACELRVGNRYLCGTIDYVGFRPGLGYILKDWKTNKKFEFENPYMFLPPLDHLPTTEYYAYALQQNLYRRLLGIDVKKMEVVWFRGEGWEVIDIPFMDKEITLMLNHLMVNMQ